MLSALIPSSDLRKKFRNRYAYNIAKVVTDKNNIINIPKNRNINIRVVGEQYLRLVSEAVACVYYKFMSAMYNLRSRNI